MRNQIKCPKCKKFIKGTSQYCPYCDILISSEKDTITKQENKNLIIGGEWIIYQYVMEILQIG